MKLHRHRISEWADLIDLEIEPVTEDARLRAAAPALTLSLAEALATG